MMVLNVQQIHHDVSSCGANTASGYLADVPSEDAQQPGHLQLLPASRRQLLDPVSALDEGPQPGLDACALLPTQALLQQLGQLLRRHQLQREQPRCSGKFSSSAFSSPINTETRVTAQLFSNIFTFTFYSSFCLLLLSD